MGGFDRIGVTVNMAGRRALVTGGTQGIGAVIARSLAAAGADVLVQGLENLTDPIPGVETMLCDLVNFGAASDLWQHTVARLGAPEIIIHCASIEMRAPFHQFDRAAAERQMAINLWAGVELFSLAAPGLCERNWGRLIAIGSVQQTKPHPDMLAYAASKAALENAVRNIAFQVAPYGVTANVIAPGVITTPRTAPVLADSDYAAKLLHSIPAGRFGTPDDIVGTALLLASDAAAYINGQTIFVDGLKSF